MSHASQYADEDCSPTCAQKRSHISVWHSETPSTAVPRFVPDALSQMTCIHMPVTLHQQKTDNGRIAKSSWVSMCMPCSAVCV